MPIYVFDPVEGISKKVAEVDTTTMLTLKDILPKEASFTKKYLVKKENAPKARLRDIYCCQDNGALVRRIFNTFFKIALQEIVSGNCQFLLPKRGHLQPCIYVDFLPDTVVRAKAKQGRMKYVDFQHTNYTVPCVYYRFSLGTNSTLFGVYVNKGLYYQMIAHANTGKPFSSRPRDIEYFLPQLYSKFYHLEEKPLRDLIKYCWRVIHKELTCRQEIRFLDQHGEIRIYRPLGQNRDEIVRKAVKSRNGKLAKKRYESFN